MEHGTGSPCRPTPGPPSRAAPSRAARSRAAPSRAAIRPASADREFYRGEPHTATKVDGAWPGDRAVRRGVAECPDDGPAAPAIHRRIPGVRARHGVVAPGAEG